MGEMIWILIPLSAIGLGYYAMKIFHEQKMARLSSQLGSSDVARILSRLELMEQRLTVLEKLATDPSARLAREIDQLRDGRA